MAVAIKKISKASRLLRRTRKTRAIIARGKLNRLSIRRTNMHMYVQLTTPRGCRTLAQVSTRDTALKDTVTPGVARSVAAAELGRRIAEKVLALDIKKVAFDRSGFTYCGVVKALADAARKAGLEF